MYSSAIYFYRLQTAYTYMDAPKLILTLAFQTLSVWICHHTFGVMHESVTNSNKTEGQSCLLWEPLPSGKMSLFIFISSHHLPPPRSLRTLPYAFAFRLVSSKISNNLTANYVSFNISLKYRAGLDVPLKCESLQFGYRVVYIKHLSAFTSSCSSAQKYNCS